MTDEWGPWIDHDGSGFPERLRGVTIEIEVEHAYGSFERGVGVVRSDSKIIAHWCWANFRKFDSDFGWIWGRVLRYRTRQYPQAVSRLAEIAGAVERELVPIAS